MMVTIVKLGGSAALTPALPRWLAKLSSCGGRVCIVPGGGPFSDGVRHAQREMGFDNSAAHRMAILGMEQYAHALKSLCPALRAVSSPGDITDSSSAGAPSLWFPASMLIGEQALFHSWDVTSDSLAVWLAMKCGIERVVLVKQGLHDGEGDVEALSRRGYVDAALPGMLANWRGALSIATAHDIDDLLATIMDSKPDRLLRVALRRGAA